MISHDQFGKLRLSQFRPDAKITELAGWEFMDAVWVGEAVGFSEWLRLEEEPGQLRSLAIDFGEFPPAATSAVLRAIDLSIRPGMSPDELRAVLGKPSEERECAGICLASALRIVDLGPGVGGCAGPRAGGVGGARGAGVVCGCAVGPARLTSRCSGPRPRAALSASFMLTGPWPGPLSFGVRPLISTGHERAPDLNGLGARPPAPPSRGPRSRRRSRRWCRRSLDRRRASCQDPLGRRCRGSRPNLALQRTPARRADSSCDPWWTRRSVSAELWC